MEQIIGKQSIQFQQAAHILSAAGLIQSSRNENRRFTLSLVISEIPTQ